MPGKKKSSKKAKSAMAALNLRQRKYVEGVAEGKSKFQSALDAGYSQESATNAKAVIEGQRVVASLRRLLEDAVPEELVVQRIREGVDAMRTETFSHALGSKIKGTEHIELAHVDKIDLDQRRKYLEMRLKLTGHFVERHEVSLLTQLDSRSDDELKFFDKNGRWPEESQQTA